VRVGEMKGVVHACADHAKLVPSMGDVMELYKLTADPFETTNIAAVGRGPAIVEPIKRTIEHHREAGPFLRLLPVRCKARCDLMRDIGCGRYVRPATRDGVGDAVAEAK